VSVPAEMCAIGTPDEFPNRIWAKPYHQLGTYMQHVQSIPRYIKLCKEATGLWNPNESDLNIKLSGLESFCKNMSHLKQWQMFVHKLFLLQRHSANVERGFSMLKSILIAHKSNQLLDKTACTLKLRFNRRESLDVSDTLLKITEEKGIIVVDVSEDELEVV
jgi:hypothetical protein